MRSGDSCVASREHREREVRLHAAIDAVLAGIGRHRHRHEIADHVRRLQFVSDVILVPGAFGSVSSQ